MTQAEEGVQRNQGQIKEGGGGMLIIMDSLTCCLLLEVRSSWERRGGGEDTKSKRRDKEALMNLHIHVCEHDTSNNVEL